MKHIAMMLLCCCLVAVPAFAEDAPQGQKAIRESEKSGFERTWRQHRGVAHLDAGNYEVLVGDAEKPMEDCMRAFESSSTPPSCLGGFTVQRRPTTPPSK